MVYLSGPRVRIVSLLLVLYGIFIWSQGPYSLPKQTTICYRAKPLNYDYPIEAFSTVVGLGVLNITDSKISVVEVTLLIYFSSAFKTKGQIISVRKLMNYDHRFSK